MSHGVAESCPHCGEPRIGLFCEQCGYSYSAPVPSDPVPSAPGPPAPGPPAPGPPPAGPLRASSWWVVITLDRDYFEARNANADSFIFPAASSSRRIALTGDMIRIGRRSTSRRTTPEIDLACPPADPGVSREHARLLAQPDGSWALVDEGSMNGTYLNGGTQRIPANQQVPLADRDRVHLGIWTAITLHLDP